MEGYLCRLSDEYYGWVSFGQLGLVARSFEELCPSPRIVLTDDRGNIIGGSVTARMYRPANFTEGEHHEENCAETEA